MIYYYVDRWLKAIFRNTYYQTEIAAILLTSINACGFITNAMRFYNQRHAKCIIVCNLSLNTKAYFPIKLILLLCFVFHSQP